MTTTLFANPDETEIGGLTRLIGPGAAGDNVGRHYGGCRGGLEELAT